MKIGYCLTGSFCTFSKSIKALESIVSAGHMVVPIMSENAYSTDTRFGKAVDFQNKLVEITGNSIIHTIDKAEPIGPQKMFDVLCIAPCTGNTLAKLALGITDIGSLLNYKNYYFVPFGMDDCDSKPKSMVCDFSQILFTIETAAQGIEVNQKIL